MTPPPRDPLAALAALEARVAHLQLADRMTRAAVSDPAGAVDVAQEDAQDAGRRGVRVWSSAGALVHDLTTP